jgi:hypothetical protein
VTPVAVRAFPLLLFCRTARAQRSFCKFSIDYRNLTQAILCSPLSVAPLPEYALGFAAARLLMDDRSFNRGVIASVIAALIIVGLVAYVLAAVVRITSRDPSQNSTGTTTDAMPPIPLTSSSRAAGI